jgi:class 3 adenylate cyclase
VFGRFDKLVEQHGVEKIKTIGDAYMVAGGVPDRRPGHVEAIAALALEIPICWALTASRSRSASASIVAH